jgi:hypothetical protein
MKFPHPIARRLLAFSAGDAIALLGGGAMLAAIFAKLGLPFSALVPVVLVLWLGWVLEGLRHSDCVVTTPHASLEDCLRHDVLAAIQPIELDGLGS